MPNAFRKDVCTTTEAMLPEKKVSHHDSDSTNALLIIPSSNPFATPEKLQTAVQKKSQTLKISGGHAFTAATVALTRLDLPMLTSSAGRTLGTEIQHLYVRRPMPRAEAPILTSNCRHRTLGMWCSRVPHNSDTSAVRTSPVQGVWILDSSRMRSRTLRAWGPHKC